jgi:hypothetical protein
MSVVTLAIRTTGSRDARTGGIGSGPRKPESCWSIMQPRPSGAGVPEGCSLGQNYSIGIKRDVSLTDRPGAKKTTRRAGKEWTHLTRACRAATGRRGVTDSFERRSLSEEAERERFELERSERSIMAVGVVGRSSDSCWVGFSPNAWVRRVRIPIWCEARVLRSCSINMGILQGFELILRAQAQPF